MNEWDSKRANGFRSSGSDHSPHQIFEHPLPTRPDPAISERDPNRRSLRERLTKGVRT